MKHLIAALISGICLLGSAQAEPTDTASDLESGVRELAQQISVGMSNASIHKIAIVDFTDLSGQVSALGQFLAEELTTQLFLVSPAQFQVVERRQLIRVLEEQRLTMTGLIDAATLADVGKILGIEALVTGSITDLGNEVKVNARLIAIDTARVFAVAAARIPNVGTVRDLISKRALIPAPPAGPDRRHPASGIAPGARVAAGLLQAEARSLSVLKGGEQVTFALRLENVSDRPFYLAAAGEHAARLTDDRGAAARRAKVTGVPTIAPWDRDRKEEYVALDPGSTTVLLFVFEFREPATGSRFSFSCQFYQWLGEEEHAQFSIGLSDLVPDLGAQL